MLAAQDWVVRMDCYYDTNTGAGDDRCAHQLRCDALDPGASFFCPHDANATGCGDALDAACLSFCLPVTPNGCDCFGCCEVDGVHRYVGHGSGCGSSDPAQCPACTPDPVCVNDCDPDACELCFLQAPDALPDHCEEPSCQGGAQPCTGPEACGPDAFCQTGCCRPITPT